MAEKLSDLAEEVYEAISGFACDRPDPDEADIDAFKSWFEEEFRTFVKENSPMPRNVFPMRCPKCGKPIDE